MENSPRLYSELVESMRSTWAVARRAAFTDLGVDGGGADSSGVRKVDGLGAVRAGAGAVRAEYATPLSALAGESPHRGRAALWAADSAGVTGMGNAHAVSGPGYVHVMESVLSDPALGGVSRAGGADGVGSDRAWE